MTSKNGAVEIQPDVTGIDRSFQYLPPKDASSADPPLAPGAIVRMPLGPRNVRGWVLGDATTSIEPNLRHIERVVSYGPSPELIDLGRFGAWRYAGRLRPFLVAASPHRDVRAVPGAPSAAQAPRPVAAAAVEGPGSEEIRQATREALEHRFAILRLPPLGSRLTVVIEVLRRVGRDVLVLCAEHQDVTILQSRLERLGVSVARHPDNFAAASAGGRVVIGTRTGAFAPSPSLAAVLVLDSHASAYREERAPTWDATVIAAERARAAGVPCLFVSPCPPLTQLALAPRIEVPRAVERGGWPSVQVLDRRGDDPRSGLYSEGLATIIHAARDADPDRPVVLVLNRTGRARLLSCSACGELARCEHCGSPLRQRERPEDGSPAMLECTSCGRSRPVICAACGARRLRLLRVGTARAREELAALLHLEVAEVSGPRGRETVPESAPVLVGTEAVLHRVRQAALVVFLDFDQELLASRFVAAEQAFALLARAARLLGPRRRGLPSGRIVIQTRLPDHEVVVAAVNGDPSSLATREGDRRRRLGLPPYRALALISGDALDAARSALALVGLEVAERDDDTLLVRAADSSTLADALGTLAEHEGLRVEVDPVGV